jgi:hypothetical protein
VDDRDKSDYVRLVLPIIARLLLLIAVLLMPLGMTPPAANAAGHQAMAAMPMGHCDERAPNHAPKAGFADCTMACSAALPAIDLSRDEPPPVAHLPLRAAVALILHGLHPDTATPPPKLA